MERHGDMDSQGNRHENETDWICQPLSWGWTTRFCRNRLQTESFRQPHAAGAYAEPFICRTSPLTTSISSCTVAIDIVLEATTYRCRVENPYHISKLMPNFCSSPYLSRLHPILSRKYFKEWRSVIIGRFGTEQYSNPHVSSKGLGPHLEISFWSSPPRLVTAGCGL